ncbi:unnamed protein product, partial [Tenebrio molitor]
MGIAINETQWSHLITASVCEWPTAFHINPGPSTQLALIRTINLRLVGYCLSDCSCCCHAADRAGLAPRLSVILPRPNNQDGHVDLLLIESLGNSRLP